MSDVTEPAIAEVTESVAEDRVRELELELAEANTKLSRIRDAYLKWVMSNSRSPAGDLADYRFSCLLRKELSS